MFFCIISCYNEKRHTSITEVCLTCLITAFYAFVSPEGLEPSTH